MFYNGICIIYFLVGYMESVKFYVKKYNLNNMIIIFFENIEILY